jgi:hypothetical protein
MQKHTIKVEIPTTVTTHLQCQIAVLDMLGEQGGKDFTNLIIKYKHNGDIWFYNLDIQAEGDQKFMYATRVFDSAKAKESFVTEAAEYFSGIGATVVSDEAITFEAFAAYAADKNESIGIPAKFAPPGTEPHPEELE